MTDYSKLAHEALDNAKVFHEPKWHTESVTTLYGLTCGDVITMLANAVLDLQRERDNLAENLVRVQDHLSLMATEKVELVKALEAIAQLSSRDCPMCVRITPELECEHWIARNALAKVNG